MAELNAAGGLLTQAVRDGAFPGAVAEVGTHGGPAWEGAFGTLDADPTRATIRSTVFDLASLTKVIATTTLAMRGVEAGSLTVSDRVNHWLPAWRGTDRETVTLADLLAHASGLTAHLPFFRDHIGRADFEHAICTLPLEYSPRTRSVYSDLGFILLGFILADGDTQHQPIDRQFSALANARGWGELRYRPPSGWRARTAPTEVDPWRGRLAVAEVHDQNAWALQGVAGHAGLFGTAAAVGRFARDVLCVMRGESSPLGPLVSRVTMTGFTEPTPVPRSSRALGWDTMRPTSSCGTRMSPVAVGHTGFTGTSLWIDPRADVYVVLLTNRVHPTRANDAILAVRPAFHDAVMAAMA